MKTILGVDIGAVGLKAALIVQPDGLNSLSARAVEKGWRRPAFEAHSKWTVLIARYSRTKGRPMEAFRGLLRDVDAIFEGYESPFVVVTGQGGEHAANLMGVRRCNEFQSVAAAVGALHPAVRTVFEMGGESSKYIRLQPESQGEGLGILDYNTNGDCAAGTGAFLDQQAGRLKYAVEDIGSIVQGAERAAQIAGRCSVFAKSDMIHAQQKGFIPPEVLRGLCNAVAVNFKSAVVKGREIVPPVALIGGVSANSAVVSGLRETFELADAELFVPDGAESFGAIGAALVGLQEPDQSGLSVVDLVKAWSARPDADDGRVFSRSAPLTLDKVLQLRDRVREYDFDGNGHVIDAYLGLDIGSVGTKLVLIDEHGDVIHHIFTRTEGRPIEVVSRCLLEMKEAVGDRVRICGVGSTGSGRELIGELVGADSINDEITAHKTGASYVGDRMLGQRPDTIFEIGGQDSKYISLQQEGGDASGDTIVVDFTMNDACAAGTGSFLEERAEELGVSIKGEFSQLALSSRSPIRLGERCTVFMERDVNTCMQRGAKLEDIIAGLAYSVVHNYINRVVRGRPIGKCVFFQGGTAYNDAVAAAFSIVTGRQIVVPPHNAVLGAIGAALLAREKMKATGQVTRFRGYHMEAVDYTLREFMCKGCGNHCSVQEFKVEGEKTFWGDKCSDRYRKRTKTDRKPVIRDLVTLRHELLHADATGDPPSPIGTIGVPMAMYSFDLLPLWRRFFRDCGFAVVLSEETNRRIVQMGLNAVVAEPCFPITVAHGHVADLIAKKVDYIWLPNILSAETKFLDNESHVCPWGQTLPYVIRQASTFRSWAGRILCPTLRFREGAEAIREELVRLAVGLGVARTRAQEAFACGWAELQRFREEYEAAGREALQILEQTGESGMVLVGRPYNIHDAGVSLSAARKLREHYGVNVLPIDALALSDVDVRDVNENMYWDYGRRILAAAKLVAEKANLHVIYITNFKCGPDSFVKGFIRPASGKPFLTLQFDGHSNDAGMMTRCEAYLDSKGILRWWRQSDGERLDEQVSEGEPSISRPCPTPAPA